MHGEQETVGGSGTAPPRASPAHGAQMGPSASYLEGLTPPSAHSGDEGCAEQLYHCLPAFGFMGFCCFGLFFFVISQFLAASAAIHSKPTARKSLGGKGRLSYRRHQTKEEQENTKSATSSTEALEEKLTAQKAGQGMGRFAALSPAQARCRQPAQLSTYPISSPASMCLVLKKAILGKRRSW